ncbi:MAG: M15 family metallopeptidase [Clostridia bacterium]
MKRDPYKTLLRVSGILAIIVVVGIGVFYLCSLAVTNDYVTRRNQIEKQNAEAEVAFNTKMNELRNNQNAAVNPETGEVTVADLPVWEKTLGGNTWRIEDEGVAGLENTGTITLERSSLITGGLLLVNAWHALPFDFSDAEVVSVGSASSYKIQVQDSSIKLFPNAFKALSECIDAAEAAGIKNTYILREAYRTNEVQSEYFNNRMEKESKKYSGDILIEQTKKFVNYPGTSEYQSGMAFRLDLYTKEKVDLPKYSVSEQGKWFTENCWKYGIIFRFPTENFPSPAWEDKSYKTGITTAMNLYRYVGKAHAAAMSVLDYCLEEYVEFLIDHPHICIYEDDALKYEIVRIRMTEDTASFSLPVPNPANDYQASMDNMGGIVMAYSYN